MLLFNLCYDIFLANFYFFMSDKDSEPILEYAYHTRGEADACDEDVNELPYLRRTPPLIPQEVIGTVQQFFLSFGLKALPMREPEANSIEVKLKGDVKIIIKGGELDALIEVVVPHFAPKFVAPKHLIFSLKQSVARFVRLGKLGYLDVRQKRENDLDKEVKDHEEVTMYKK